MKKAIIFDLDGTLWDSADAVVAGFNEVLRGVPEFSLQLSKEDVRGLLGKLLVDITRDLLPKNLSDGRIAELNTALCEGDVAYLARCGAPLYPFVRETLCKLKEDYALYIVSNCQKNYIETFLEFHRLQDLFCGHLCAGDTGKPKADNIRTVIEKYGIDRALYIGDTDGDFRAATAAGMPFLHAAYGYGKPHIPTPSVSAFEELPRAVKEYLG